MSARVPTENQYRLLRVLGSGAALVCGTRREVGPLVKHGWVTANYEEDRAYPYSFARITPAGLRALALAVERYGWPEIPKAREAA